jgi:hypothetical protein
MTPFRVRAITPELADAARSATASPQYGHPATIETAKGYGPCRLCLRPFRVGAEARLLFTYDPFEGLGQPPAPGPIFIHADGCEPFAGPGFPDAIRHLPLLLESYGRDGLIAERVRPGGAPVEAAIGRLLADPGVEFIHVRNAEAGCYIAQVFREG